MRTRTIALRAALGAVFLLLAAMIGIATIPLGYQPSLFAARFHGRAEMAVTGSGELRAGAARVELRVPPHGPVAGYPAWRRDDGSGEPLYVRALALEQGPLSAVLVSLPLLMVPGPLEEEIARRAGLGAQRCLTVAATHTHAGPGGTWDNLLVELGGNGLYSSARLDAVAQAAADAIAQARARLAPARVTASMESWPDGPAVARSGEIDPSLGAVRLLGEGDRPIASVVLYGMHATVIPRRARGLSGDWPEAAAQLLERASGAPALVLQGAGGNATFSRQGLAPEPRVAAEQLGARVAAFAIRQLATAPIAPATAPLSCATHLVSLPQPRAGLAVPWPVRRAAGNLLRLYSEREAIESTLSLPGLELRGVPGEPSGELGQASRRASGKPQMLLGLADGYVGYVESAARWNAAAGESERSWYGPLLAQALGLESR